MPPRFVTNSEEIFSTHLMNIDWGCLALQTFHEYLNLLWCHFSLCQAKKGFFPRLHAKMKTNKQDIEIPLIIILKLLGSQDSGIRISSSVFGKELQKV